MKRAPLRMILLAVVVTLASQAAFSQFTLKVGVDLVNVLFTVTDSKGRLIPGLGPKDFVVEEEGQRQQILNFARENELPLTMALLVDTSPSVRPVFEEEKQTAVSFLRAIMRPADLSLIIGFDQSVTLIQDYTEDVDSLEKAIDTLELGGGTSVYDAVYLACTEKLGHEAGRKAIILISDGADTTSKVKLPEALKAAQESNAVIYSISNSDRGFFNRRRGFGSGDPSTLKKFSEETGGGVFFLDDSDGFRKIFDQIAKELRAQYSLGYISTNTAKDGKYRRIKITSRDSKYKVQARKGYYAAKDPETQ